MRADSGRSSGGRAKRRRAEDGDMIDGLSALTTQAEADLYRAVNAVVEPLVRAGFASPGLLPTGLIVLETTGARSGQPRRVPLVATIFDGCVFLATVRGARSLWITNVVA